MDVGHYKIPYRVWVKEWFKDREPLISNAGNAEEMRHRLKWLSEGALWYCMKEPLFSVENYDPEVKQRQVDLFEEFIKENMYLIRLSKPRNINS